MILLIHAGENVMVRSRDLIMILDHEAGISSPVVKDFLKARAESVINLSSGEAKSIIVTKEKIYLSPFASGTLKKRADVFSNSLFSSHF